MKLSIDLQRKLSSQFEANAFIKMKYKGNEIQFKTDAEGNPILLFIGSENNEGKIKGARYTRTFKKNKMGVIIKDHWDLKGKAT